MSMKSANKFPKTTHGDKSDTKGSKGKAKTRQYGKGSPMGAANSFPDTAHAHKNRS